MSKKILFKFNVKNVKYALKGQNGYDTPVDLAYATSISLEADYQETKLYGDGEVLAILGDDKGKTGTLGVIDLNTTYEIAMKRALQIAPGLADIQQRGSVEHAIYFETDGATNEGTKTFKTWLFGVTTGKASESYEQTTDSATINNYEYPLTILGTTLLTSTSATYYDDNGNTIKVYKVTVEPGDTGYATFGDAVPEVKMPA